MCAYFRAKTKKRFIIFYSERGLVYGRFAFGSFLVYDELFTPFNPFNSFNLLLPLRIL